MKRKIGKLCVITDTVVQKKYTHVEITQMAIRGGAGVIQFRDKLMSTHELIETAKELRRICKKAGVLFIVNDRTDVALVADADGVHLGIEDIPVKEARKLLGKNKIIGGTAHSIKEAEEAQKNSADYIGFGHIYPTLSKHKITPPLGIYELARVVKEVKIPVLAIGGIGLNNISEVVKTGVYGVAVIGSVLKNKNPENAVKELRRIIYAQKI
jgi:thiamine-phosphate pyrophosphorylase